MGFDRALSRTLIWLSSYSIVQAQSDFLCCWCEAQGDIFGHMKEKVALSWQPGTLLTNETPPSTLSIFLFFYSYINLLGLVHT
jgi:hypothetical protein